MLRQYELNNEGKQKEIGKGKTKKKEKREERRIERG